MATQSTFDKQITYDHGDYRMELDGRLIGYARTYHEAEVTLDQVVSEMLTHGDCATATELDGGAGDPPDGATCQCRTCIHPATHNVNGTLACCFHYSEELTGVLCGCADDDYADAAWESNHGSYNGKVPSDFTNPEADPPNEPSSLGEDEGDTAPSAVNWNSATSRAVTAQSIQIDATMRRCHNCGADHRTWQCPEIAQALFRPEPAPWYDVALGRELCRMKWHNFKAFVALLLAVPSEHLIIYAHSYQAFIRSYAASSPLTITEILAVWARDMQRAGDRVPAEMARQVAA